MTNIRTIIERRSFLVKIAKVVHRPVVYLRSEKETRQSDDWVRRHMASTETLERQKIEAANFKYRPLISIIVPVYNVAEAFFNEMVSSVITQTYENWELVLVDDASSNPDVRNWIAEYSAKNGKIVHKFLKTNHRISGATNEGIRIARGEFVALLDNDDVLFPDALYEIVKTLNDDKSLSLIYTDEVKLDKNNRYYHPFFKTAWNPDFLRSANYITHFAAIRRSVLERVGYEDSQYDGTQDWELFLRVTRNIEPEEIRHIPRILYSWRVHDNSTAKSLDAKPYVIVAQERTLRADCITRGCSNATVEQDPTFIGQWHISYAPKMPATVALFVMDGGIPSIENLNRQITIEQYIIASKFDFKNKLATTKADYILLVASAAKRIDMTGLTEMIGDAERVETGFVLCAFPSEKQAIAIAAKTINPEAAELVCSMSHLSATNHLYTTAKYNIDEFQGGIALIETTKLRRISQELQRPDMTLLSMRAIQIGYRNVYNPYIQMVK